MGFEQKVNQQLNKHPKIKKMAKHVYQHTMYAISPKIRSEGNIIRLSPDDGAEYFFGYYDKSPWDAAGRHVICLRAKDTWSSVAPKEKADILLIDLEKEENDAARVKKIAETHSWNVQQGCMAQWLGPDFDRKIIYNDFRNGSFCSVVLDVLSGEERQLPMPVYSVSADGRTALTLDFARLHRLRPGYGYSNIEDRNRTRDEKIPDGPCIWKMDIETGEAGPLLKYGDFASFEPRPEMAGAEHKVNHIMLSPSGQRFMVLHRWFKGQRKYTRLVTCDIDGSNMYNLSDDDMVSHCCWKNDREILAYENKRNGGLGYYLMKDKTHEYTRMWPELTADGHPSYSPDGKYVVTDTYPDRARVACIRVMDGDEVRVAARVFAPFKYDNDTRCDLHPRWSRDGKKICFDAVFEGHRGLYGVSWHAPSRRLTMVENKKKQVIVYLVTSCKKVGPIQQTLNIIRYLDRDRFEPILITLYDEPTDGTSQLDKFIALGVRNMHVSTGKKDVVFGDLSRLKKVLDEIGPVVIHSLGVFPDYAVGRMHYNDRQVMVLRNYMHDDFLSKFGPIQGRALEALQMRAVYRAKKVLTCSRSLSDIYKERKGLAFDYICNGVDVEAYHRVSDEERKKLRKRLGLPADRMILVYAGQFVPRKDQAFILQAFADGLLPENAYLLLLGSGPEFMPLREKYGQLDGVDLRGMVTNVSEYLQCSDLYISSSKSEGLPNGVLEAMATGLPMVLSDIPQHREIVENDRNCGCLFPLDDEKAFAAGVKKLLAGDISTVRAAAENVVSEHYDARITSRAYQTAYLELAGQITTAKQRSSANGYETRADEKCDFCDTPLRGVEQNVLQHFSQVRLESKDTK